MSLERYRQKRDFKTTPEPRGHVAKGKHAGLTFVIQKHAASHLHYDFRLELDGVLLSWAVPKGPSLDPADKRLAMHVEDHPLEYGGFEGTIPPKQYGGGTVMLWDRGTWTPKGDPTADYARGRLKFELDGDKLHGGWTLVRTHSSKYGSNGKQAWLLIKENDEFARRGVDARVVDDLPNSVLSGRSMEDIAQDREHVWQSNRSVAANVKAGAVAPVKAKRNGGATSADAQDSIPVPTPAKTEGARKSSLPPTFSPELATLVDAVPEGDNWLHELKYDGYRMVCRVESGKVRIFSRNGKEWTDALPGIAAAVKKLPLKSAWIDGEVAMLAANGTTSFQLLQNALADPNAAALVYFVFDLPYRDGYDLRKTPLTERKRHLRAIVPESDPVVRYGIEVLGSGPDFFAQACKLKLEGVVSKRADSMYHEGARTREWLKIKCGRRQEMVIGGFTDPQGGRTGFGALLLGVYEDGGTLRYSGRVGTGFDDRTLTSLRKTLDKLAQDAPAFSNPPRGYEAKGVHWVKPELVAEIAFTEWTTDGTLRHPSFQGLREDKKAIEVTRERPLDAPDDGNDAADPAPPAKTARAAKAKPREPAKRSADASADAAPAKTAKRTSAATKPAAKAKAKANTVDAAGDTIAGVKLSHPDKLLFPEANLTKRDLARYYEGVSKWMVPHLNGRPLSLVRCPDGWKGQCFYQKHADKSVNPAVERVEVPEGKSTAMYMSAGSVTAVVALLQWGVVELHPWGSKKPKLDRPDRLIFDFDPDDGVGWDEVVAGVRLMKTLLDDVGLRGFLKTTGGKGMHVVVPIKPTLDWTQAKAFTKAVSELIVNTFPDRYLATMSKAQRKGKIFIDYLRNGEGATAIAPYSLRARANAPVSVPIAWEELDRDVRFAYFNATNVPDRLARLKKDPWADFFDHRQTVTKAMITRVGGK
jgi:bifunctional non-homologous end joining protein LigD